jgi:MFS family permease
LIRSLSRDNKLMMLSLFWAGFADGLIMYIQPLYIQWLGANPLEIGGVLSIAMFAVCFAYIPVGRLVDKMSRKALIIPAWMMAFVALLLMAYAPDWRWMLPGLLIYQLSAYDWPVIQAFIADAADRTNLADTFIIVWGGYSFGSVFSPLASGIMVEWLGFRAVYLISAFFTLISMIILFFLHNQYGKATESLVPMKKLFANRSLIALLGIYFVSVLAMYAGQPLAPNFVKQQYGVPISEIGLFGSLNSLGAVLISILLTRGRRSEQWLQVANMLMMSFSYGIMLMTGHPVGLMAVFFFRGSFQAFKSIGGAHITRKLGSEAIGLGLGLYNTFIGLAIALAPLLAGWLYSMRPEWSVLIPLCALPIAMLLMLTRPARGEAMRPSAQGEIITGP